MPESSLQDEEIRNLICRTANEVLQKHGHFVCEIFEGFDHAGEEALFIDICYTQDAVPVPADDTLILRTRLRSALLETGEARFPFIGYRLEQEAAA
jgi:hypothetical protein